MKKYIYLLVVGIMTTMIGLMSCSSPKDEPGKVEDDPGKVEPLPEFEMTPAEYEIAKAQSNFQIEMFADIVKEGLEGEDNLNFSPINATIALSVLANAADDENAKKISDLIGYNDLDALNAYNLRLNQYLPQQPEGNTLELASGVWYENGLTLLPQFVETVTGVYGATPTSVFFEKDETVEFINAWASEKTNGLIKNIVSRQSLPASTQMFIASALYYKGLWENAFDKNNTKDRVFHGACGDMNVPTMYRKGQFNYNRIEDGAEILKLPFTDYRVSLYVVLPPEETDVVEYASTFDAERFDAMVGDMDIRDFMVYIPKFTFKSQIYLNKYLLQNNININSFGMSGAGISGYVPLSSLQQTYFCIEEKGVEMAAVTSLATSMPYFPEYKDFKVDRPFIFFVREAKTGSILMAGVMRDIPKEQPKNN